MTVRSMWTGTVGFGLAVIPVKLGNAVSSDDDLGLHRYRTSDASPVKMRRYAVADGQDVAYEDTSAGYETGSGQTVLLDDGDFARAYGPKSRAAKILMFTDPKAVPRTAHEASYYVEPDKGAEKAYALLAAVLERTGKAAVVSIMIREREANALLYTRGDGYLVLERLQWASRVRKPDFAAPPETLFTSRELAQAKQLVEMMDGTFDWQNETDKSAEALQRVIQGKLETGQALGTPVAPAEGTGTTAAVDLMAALTASIEAARAAREPAPVRKPRPRKAALPKERAA